MELKKYIETVDARLLELMKIDHAHKTMKEAMQYSLMAGGKRLRPLLNIFANELLGGKLEETLDIACAIEMIHTFSLMHDDLPAVDNDDMRRGKPTSHVVFGEATAILAGDALLNYAFEVMLQNALQHTANLEAHVRAVSEVARGAGVTGMITGQFGDIENEGKELEIEEVVEVHRHKTGDMIRAALISGLLLCKPNEAQISALSEYGYKVGLAFQVIDDILDVTGDQEKMGKTLGKDSIADKQTFPALIGLEESRKMAKALTDEGISSLAIFGKKAGKLEELAQMMLERDH